jgi:hypothetical protein
MAYLVAYSVAYSTHLASVVHMWLLIVQPASWQAVGQLLLHPRVYSFQILVLTTVIGHRLGATGYISLVDVFSFKDPYKQQEARGLSIYASPSGDAYWLQEHFMTSLEKALRQRLFLLSKTWWNKNASKFNHKTLGGLIDQSPRGSLRGLQPGWALSWPTVCWMTRVKVAWTLNYQGLT